MIVTYNKTIEMKTFTTLICMVLLSVTSVNAQNKSFYDFNVKTINGQNLNLSSFKGMKVLIVNVASKCGNTPQYEKLQMLFDKYGKNNFVVIGFPANNFMGQEPGTNEEIQQFCTLNYHVTFPMMAKISVKGKDIDPLYKWLTEKTENGKQDAEVTWNFQKFMIDKNGNWVGVVAPNESPMCDKIIEWIEKE